MFKHLSLKSKIQLSILGILLGVSLIRVMYLLSHQIYSIFQDSGEVDITLIIFLTISIFTLILACLVVTNLVKRKSIHWYAILLTIFATLKIRYGVYSFAVLIFEPFAINLGGQHYSLGLNLLGLIFLVLLKIDKDENVYYRPS